MGYTEFVPEDNAGGGDDDGEDGSGAPAGGCDLDPGTLYLADDGQVFFNAGGGSIGGFQFDVAEGSIDNAGGGEAVNAGFMVSASSTTVIAFSLSGATIEGCGTLVEITGDASGLANIIVSDASGSDMGYTEYEIGGCAGVVDCNGDCDGSAVEDCAGVCDGSSEVDECGECGGDGIDEGACDCAGNTLDCAGACGGSAEIDECGTCGGPGAVGECGCDDIPEGACDCEGSVLDECGECGGDGIDEGACDCAGNTLDCAGVCAGTSVIDECGECGGDGIDEGACDCAGNTLDCAGECGGSTEVDDCGVCGGGNSDIDECGVCFGDSSSCEDCAGTPNGDAALDSCGVCSGGDSGNQADSDVDECGVCFGSGTSTYYEDTDGDGNGAGTGSEFCSDPGAGWSSNDSDACPNDVNDDTDGDGICDSEDDSSFDVVQSQEQAFYIFDSAGLDGSPLESGDWILAYSAGGILVAAEPWAGAGTEVVVMGAEHYDDGFPEESPVDTDGFTEPGETPRFHVYDNSTGGLHEALLSSSDGTALQALPAFNSLDINTGLSLELVTDCDEVLGGAATTSGVCGDCWGGDTSNDMDYMDTDSDGVCNEGASNGDADNCPDTPNNGQENNDTDALGNACDDDDDNDGETDDLDNDDDNANVCHDYDGDGCDECSTGSLVDQDADGDDFDSDGLCDSGDGSPYGEVSLSFASPSSDTSIEVLYSSDMPIHGFQFTVSGITLTDAVDGNLELVESNENTVVAFDTDGDPLPAGEGSFVVLSFQATLDASTISLSDIVVGGQGGTELISTSETGQSLACTNFDEDELCDVDADNDDDNDGETDDLDEDDNNASVCHDYDGDGCDECADGSLDTTGGDDDGDDFDADGTCDSGDASPWGEASISFSEATSETSIDVLYSSDMPIHGFQFNVNGIVLTNAEGAEGGNLEMVSSNGNGAVVGFDLDGDPLPAGEGILAVLSFEATLSASEISLADLIVGGLEGTELISTSETGQSLACTNFDEDELCDVDADNDDDNDGETDDLDEDDNNASVCHDYDGDGCDECADGSLDTTGGDDDGDDFDADGTCDSGDGTPWGEVALSLSGVGVDGASLDFSATTNIAGFQFDVSGVTLTDASGGEAEATGFMVSSSESTVIAFSLDGSSIEAGSGTLIDLSFLEIADGSTLSISNIIFSATNGKQQAVSIPEDAEVPACADNEDDNVCDVYDEDDDNDGALDENDSHPFDQFLCSDDDGDTCDDCSSGSYDTADDGDDFDGDGMCDAGDDSPGGDIALSFANVTETSADIIYSGANVSINGYQFTVEGVTLTGASDGDLDISVGGNSVVGWSMSGAALEPGSGSLVSLTFAAELDGASLSISGLVIGTSGGAQVTPVGPDAANVPACANNDGDDLCDIDADNDDDNDGCADADDPASLDWSDDYDNDGEGADCDVDDDNDGALDGDDSDDANEFVCSDSDDDECDDCSSGSFDTSNDGADYDGDGSCDLNDPVPVAIFAAQGAMNTAYVDFTASDAAEYYNVYDNGQLVGTTDNVDAIAILGEPYNTAFGLPYWAFQHLPAGFALAPESTHCYTATVVDADGDESDPSNEVCATTLPPATAFTSAVVDPTPLDLGGGATGGMIHIVGYNLWFATGFQFSVEVSDNITILDVAYSDGTQYGFDLLQYGNGTVLGSSLSGGAIPPQNPLAGDAPAVYASLLFTNTCVECSGPITAQVTDAVYATDTMTNPNNSHTDCSTDALTGGFDACFNPIIGTYDDFAVDCANEWFGGADGWDYTDGCGECDENPLTDCVADYNVELHDGANLVSFHSLPAATDVTSIFGGVASGVIGEGVVAYNNGDGFVGSLTDVTAQGGYWVKVSGDQTLSLGAAEPTQDDGQGGTSAVVYDLHEGNNLVSYPFQTSQSVVEALGDAAGSIWGLAGEGVAAMHIGNDWYGSLDNLEPNKGYWIVSLSDQSFSYEGTGSLARTSSANTVREVPEEFAYLQSSNQAFYFVESAMIDGEALESEDVLVAYNGDVVVGSRYWNGEFTDVPAMGFDGSDEFAGYCQQGDAVTFKVYDSSEGKLVDVAVEGSTEWQNVGMHQISLSTIETPMNASLNGAYPNPFNPTTSISYSVPADMNITLAIYDIRGRLVDQLVSGIQTGGVHNVTWSAADQASGVYVMKLVAGSTVQTQKIMLIK